MTLTDTERFVLDNKKKRPRATAKKIPGFTQPRFVTSLTRVKPSKKDIAEFNDRKIPLISKKRFNAGDKPIPPIMFGSLKFTGVQN